MSVCVCEIYSVEYRIFFRLSHVALCIDGIWKKQIIADSACHYSDCANSGKCYEFKKYKKYHNSPTWRQEQLPFHI